MTRNARSPRRALWGLGIALAALLPIPAVAQPPASATRDTVFVYGPGGPLPAIKEAAAVFGRLNGVEVQVTGGPTPQWIEAARRRADVIYSGSENMMTDFVGAMQGQLVESTIEPLYLRPAAILVRRGNPKKITGFRDLLKPGMRVMVVSGAGQVGMWEDIAGRTGRIETVRAFRRNIAVFAPNSGEAKRTWQSRSDVDAWLIWSIWWVANRDLADMVAVERDLVVYRDAGVALTTRGRGRPLARRFIEFLRSPQGARIFARWGWADPAGRISVDPQRGRPAGGRPHTPGRENHHRHELFRPGAPSDRGSSHQRNTQHKPGELGRP